jgi:phosphinothricin acetyltransferase
MLRGNTPALNIRSANIGDAAAIRAIYAPIVADTTISFEDIPPSVEEIARRIDSTLKAYPYLVADHDGEVVGYAYASEHRTRSAYRYSVDVAVYVAPGARRTGVGRRLYEPLLAGITSRGYHAAFAGIALPNPASVALHEAFGFTHLGTYREVGFKFGRWLDVGWWQRVLLTPPAAGV